MNSKNFRNFLKKMKVKKYFFPVFVGLIIIGLILIDLFCQFIDIQLDLTKTHLYTLTDNSVQIIKNLKKPVTINALYKKNSEPDQVMALLHQYKQYSQFIKINTLDPDKDYHQIRLLNQNENEATQGSLIITDQKKSRLINPYELYEFAYTDNGETKLTGLSIEKELTNAIYHLIHEDPIILYELSGHQEESLNFIGVANFLTKSNYQIKQLNLLSYPAVPEETDILLIIAPKQDLTNQETEKILNYLKKAGKCIFIFDHNSQKMPNFAYLLKIFGLEMINGYVVENDPDFTLSNLPFYPVPQKADHPILDPIHQGQQDIIMPFSQGIKLINPKNSNLNIVPLLTTSSNSWLKLYNEKNDRTFENSNLLIREKTDIIGPIKLAVAVTNPSTQINTNETRMVVIGTSYFLKSVPPFANRMKGNMDFLLNCLNWLYDNKNTNLMIPAKTVEKNVLELNPRDRYRYSIIIMILIPLFIALLGYMVIYLHGKLVKIRFDSHKNENSI